MSLPTPAAARRGSQKEASDRLAKNGKNKLQEAQKDTLLQRFASAEDPMLIILMAAALVSGVTSVISGEG